MNLPKVKIQQTSRNTFANIPKEIQEHLKLSKGDILNFRIKDDGSVILKKEYVKNE